MQTGMRPSCFLELFSMSQDDKDRKWAIFSVTHVHTTHLLTRWKTAQSRRSSQLVPVCPTPRRHPDSATRPQSEDLGSAINVCFDF